MQKIIKQKRNWYTTGVTTRLKNFTHEPWQLRTLRCGRSRVMFDGETHQGKNDKATTLSPSPRASTDSATPSVPCNWWCPGVTSWCAFVPSVTSKLLMVTLSAREVTGSCYGQDDHLMTARLAVLSLATSVCQMNSQTQTFFCDPQSSEDLAKILVCASHTSVLRGLSKSRSA